MPSACQDARQSPATQDPIHRAAAKHPARLRDLLLQLGRGAGVEDPEQLATDWLLLINGAITSRLVTSDDHVAGSARKIAAGLLEQRLTST